MPQVTDLAHRYRRALALLRRPEGATIRQIWRAPHNRMPELLCAGLAKYVGLDQDGHAVFRATVAGGATVSDLERVQPGERQ